MSGIVEGRVWIVGDSVNTDAMYPAFALKMPYAEAAQHVFHQLRPGWTDEVRPGDIVVAGHNFGIGSSRPVSKLFTELGVAALIAEEFNSLFYRNCINYGLPALTVPGVATAFHDGEIARLDITEGVVENRTTGARFDVPALPAMLLDILDAGGLMPRLARDGYLPA
ncbi:LeuD/DmdB family oxidoreductase small subunit [Amycolatopsis jiangsuensis]|uniref:3-isopropylmalate dehydratase small subunit n=1 Tax=Amycolatopsis jiangsuensis TaxID=1181879 RepID=A0A840J8F9_9PSEU|nr:3-isopropylmalate dehydratase [Amycolatopsis jiangsuensis]MBB4689657.1 3-isopropylmalate/(R)-2-methylmalate dehydratase small subunit [Amycolatopsis jiangsuensis]